MTTPPDLSLLYGRCVGFHKVEWEVAPPVLPPWAEVGGLCVECFSRLRSALVSLPAVAVWLEANAAAGGQASEKVSGSREAPMPLRPDVLDLVGPDSLRPVTEHPGAFLLWLDGRIDSAHLSWRDAELVRNAYCRQFEWDPHADATAYRLQIRPTVRDGSDQRGVESFRAALDYWAKRVHEESNAEWPDDHTVTGLVGFLAARMSWIADREWVREFDEEIRQMLSNARGVMPWQAELKREPKGVCEKCNAEATLVTHVADGKVVCEKRLGGCGYRRKQTEYEFRARHLEAG